MTNPARQPTDATATLPSQRTNNVVGAAIAIAVVGLFSGVVIAAMFHVAVPPAASNTATGTDAFDPFARMLQVAALVTPVLTTIVGFYFGVRASVGTLAAAESRATDAETRKDVTQQAFTRLEALLSTVPEATPALERVREQNPQAFDIEKWMSGLK